MRKTFMLARSAMVALLTGCFLPCSRLAASTPDDGPKVTYRATVDEVHLTFFNTDETGRHSTDLKVNDFVIVDNTFVVRNFLSFTHLDVNRLRVFILIDASESVADRFQRELDGVLQLIDQAKWIEDDKASVVVFGHMQPEVICTGDCRTNLAWVRMLSGKDGTTTPLFDTVVFAAGLAAQHHTRDIKPVFILFSDGEDTFSLNSLVDAIDAAVAADAQIYAIDVNAPGRPSRGSAVLQELARTTGGRYFPLESGVTGLLAALSEDLQAGYMVSYQPPNRSPGLHSIRIMPTRDLRLRFRSRHGYYYEMPTSDYRGVP
jgi:VWFA-related protein